MFNRFNKGLIIIVSSFIALLAFVLVLPTLLSTSPGQQALMNVVNAYLPGRIAVGHLNLQWFGSQTIKGAALQDPHGKEVISFEVFELNQPLYLLMFHGIHRGTGQIQGLQAEIVQDRDGNNNLASALIREAPAVIPSPAQSATVYLKNVNAAFNLAPSSELITLLVSGFASQGSIGGQFSVDLQVKGLESTQNFQSLAKMGEISLKADVSQLPVDLIDQFAALSFPECRGLIRNALGQQLDLKIDSATVNGASTVTCWAKSDHLEANLTGGFADEKFAIANAGKVQFTFTQQFYDRLCGEWDDLLNIKLQNPSNLSVLIDQLNVPLKVKQGKAVGIDLSGLTMIAHADVSPATLIGGSSVGHIELDGIKADILAPEGSDKLKLVVSGRASQNGQAVQLNVRTVFPKELSSDKPLALLESGPLFEADFTGIPTGLIDSLVGAKGLLEEALGPLANLRVETESRGRSPGLSVQVQSERLHTQPLHFSVGKQIELSQPALITAQVDAGLLNRWLGPDSKLVNMAPVNINLQSLSIPRALEELNKVQFRGQIAIDQLQANHLPVFGETVIRGLKVDVEASRGVLKSGVSALVNPHSETQSPSKNFGHNLSFNSMAEVALAKDEMKIKSLQANLSDGNFELNLATKAFNVSPRDGSMSLQFSGTASSARHSEGIIEGQVRIENMRSGSRYDWKNAILKANLQLSKLPLPLLEAVSGHEGLAAIFGKTIDLKVEANLSPKGKDKGTIEMSLQGEQMNGNAILSVTDAIRLKNPNQPAFFAWTVTPAKFSALRKWMHSEENRSERLTLLDTAHLHASLRSIEIPLKDFDWVSAGVSMDLLVDKLNIQDKRYSQRLQFEGLVAHAESKALSQKINMRVSAKQKDENNNLSDITFTGNVDNIVDAEGKINASDLSLSLEAKANKLPAGALCELGGLDPALQEKLVALAGPALDASLKVELRKMNGPVQTFLQGSNGYLSLDGYITNGVLTLKNPFEAVVNVTPELGQSVLQNVIPLLSGTLGAENPLRIGIDPEGFSMPLKQFDINNVQLGKASIEMGVMYFQNEGQLSKILNIFTPSTSDQIVVWFTPAFISIQNGVIKLERMDMLIMNTYPIALWGIVNIPGDRIDMMVGLSGQALQKAFKVPSLDQNYMMTLPYRGKIGKASIDKTKVTTKLSALTAQLLGGPQGFVIGTAIQLATNLSEDPVPPPTTDPLPWNSQTAEGQTNTDNQQNSGSPLKQIKKGAGSLLRNIFW